MKPAMSLARVGPGPEDFSEEEVMVEACPPAPGERHGCLFTSYCRSGRECSSDSFSLRRQASLQAGGLLTGFVFPDGDNQPVWESADSSGRQPQEQTPPG